MKEIAKYAQTISIAITNLMAYKINFILSIIVPAALFYFVKYHLWQSIYDVKAEGGSLAGYSFEQMINYQSWALVVFLIAGAFNSRKLAEDIRLGRISSFLLYPFDFFQFHIGNFLGFQILQFFTAVVTVAILALTELISLPTLSALFTGVAITFMAGVFWFLVQYALGLLAFWLEETWTLRVIFLIIANFFSGSIIPLEFFPDWARQLAFYTPFPFMTYLPVQFFLGNSIMPFSQAVFLLLFWIFCARLFGLFIWRQGIRLYSAAGM